MDYTPTLHKKETCQLDSNMLTLTDRRFKQEYRNKQDHLVITIHLFN